jgi:hypothetical protein
MEEQGQKHVSLYGAIIIYDQKNQWPVIDSEATQNMTNNKHLFDDY